MAQLQLTRRFGLLLVLLAALGAACSSDEDPAPKKELSCTWPETACDGVCVDPTKDPLHCGGCGVVCAEGQICEDAQCSTGCEGGEALCDGRCTDTRKDPANCGACGQACEEGQLCQRGACVTTCEDGQEACEGSCVDTQADPGHCGGCGLACDDGALCDRGECAGSCGENLKACDGGCVDVRTNRNHCGACGNGCATGETCKAGSCEPIGCASEESLCDGACVDVQVNEAHCGGCGKACPEGAICAGGKCECPEGWQECDGVCVDTLYSPNHCGQCGTKCDWGAQCTLGACECMEGLSQCGTICLDLSKDPYSCGECDLACEDLPNVDPGSAGGSQIACVDAACRIEDRCLPGYKNCDGNWKSGCHINLMDDMENCGDCGVKCNGHPKVEEATCDAGVCRVVNCEEGFGDCDHDILNGCEEAFAVNEYHCGACHQPCHDRLPNVAAAECSDGGCTLTCEDGFHDCNGDAWDGCEAHFDNDPLNCGACGIVCDSCRDGVCLEIEGFMVGSSFICATANGDVYCWGSNSHGQLGLGQGVTANKPTKIPTLSKIEHLFAGNTGACAVDEDGRAHCWGENTSGRLGSGSTSNLFTPVQISLPGKVLQIGIGGWHACALVEVEAEGNQVYCWGMGMYGQLGNGNTADSLNPVKVSITDVEKISVGAESTCALKSSGTVHCWGGNWGGELGKGDRAPAYSPVEITALGNGVSELSMGKAHGCFVTKGLGKVFCAGHKLHGRLGNGSDGTADAGDSNNFSLIPVEVLGLNGIVEIKAGDDWTCAKNTHGEVFCWGNNDKGQLGIGSFEKALTPQPLTLVVEGVGALRAKSLDLGGSTSCALSSAGGGLICWGANPSDVLGTGGGNANSPVRYPW